MRRAEYRFQVPIRLAVSTAPFCMARDPALCLPIELCSFVFSYIPTTSPGSCSVAPGAHLLGYRLVSQK